MAPAIVTAGRDRPMALIVHGCEGVGKTSFAAHAPGTIFIETRGEQGLDPLISSGQVPETPHFAEEANSFRGLLEMMLWLVQEEHTYKTVVLDTGNGAERLCHELVCKRDYKDDWTKEGFLNYYVGHTTSLTDWQRLLKAFDVLRDTRSMNVIMLCHTVVRKFSNPEGEDYDRYEPAFDSRKTWAVTHKWADAVLFMHQATSVAQVDKRAGKGKGQGGSSTDFFTSRRAPFDAKNRHGLPHQINAGTNGREAWHNFITALKEAKEHKYDDAVQSGHLRGHDQQQLLPQPHRVRTELCCLVPSRRYAGRHCSHGILAVDEREGRTGNLH